LSRINSWTSGRISGPSMLHLVPTLASVSTRLPSET
jgi:hypothetical protein